MAEYYRRGLEAVKGRADNGFRIGIPFIWCSNNLMTSFATQALLYRRMTGDSTLSRVRAGRARLAVRHESVGRLDGDRLSARRRVRRTIRIPRWRRTARRGDSCSAGCSTDRCTGPSIENLKGIALHDADEYARFNTGRMVYHDDIGDYSTNEPIMDGTANLTYLLSAMAKRPIR